MLYIPSYICFKNDKYLSFLSFYLNSRENMIILIESKFGMRDIVIGKRSNDVMLERL